MKSNTLKTLKIKSLSKNKLPLNKTKIRFNNTIDISHGFKTPKNIDQNVKAFSFSIKRKNNFNNIINENNIESMNKILGQLTNLNNKLNQIEKRKKRNLKLLKLNKTKPLIMSKTQTKNKYLLFINDYYKNKLILKKRKEENALSEEERNDNYNRFLNPDFLNFEKIEINSNELSRNTKLEQVISSENDIDSKNEENNSSHKNKSKSNFKYSLRKSKFANNLEIDKRESEKNSINLDELSIPKIFPQKKEKSRNVKENNKDEKKNNDDNNNLSDSFVIYQEHINYIKRIRENELLDLINRYKKSIQKSQLEEMSHIQRFVFPKELITYLIKMKKELIIDKYRAEYFNKLERYNLNNILHLKTSKKKGNILRNVIK